MITVSRVFKRFRDKQVLDGIDLAVPDGKVVVILGPSGIGKTVLLKVMTGLLVPDQGEVCYDGAALDYGVFSDNRKILGQLGYVFQGGALFDSMDVAGNVALPIRENGNPARRELADRVRMVLERVGMAEYAGLMPRELSGGMIRLAAIARALATDPRYVFYDEPTTGLDPVMRERICDLIVSLRDREGKTEIVVTHDLEAAERVADTIYMLREGRLSVQDGARKEHYEANRS